MIPLEFDPNQSYYSKFKNQLFSAKYRCLFNILMSVKYFDSITLKKRFNGSDKLNKIKI